jgi:hypothetical protein
MIDLFRVPILIDSNHRERPCSFQPQVIFGSSVELQERISITCRPVAQVCSFFQWTSVPGWLTPFSRFIKSYRYPGQFAQRGNDQGTVAVLYKFGVFVRSDSSNKQQFACFHCVAVFPMFR